MGTKLMCLFYTLSWLDIGCRQSFASATIDTFLFLENIRQREKIFCKLRKNEMIHINSEQLQEKFTDFWQILSDEGYIDLL